MSDAKLFRMNYYKGRVTTIPKGLLDSSLTQRMAYLLDIYKLDSVVFRDGCVRFITYRTGSEADFDVTVGYKAFIGGAGPRDGVCVDDLAIQPLDDNHLLLYEKMDCGFYIYRLLTESGFVTFGDDFDKLLEQCPDPVPTQNPPELELALPSSTPVQQQNGMEKKDASK
jgi:hypothetical protein